ncbi:hypothetical protein R3W88_009001 [Solanum pinnatisectum]|uniref:Pentatricopeptide repeat-containing protein n=1 Tax=Solanum pinnatisectum TaxID=50273 RepID=A0AAV9M9N8_9SOLN|nr:hypothetical protein R3W88_009001 [Solanum pinnatisectum]
MLEMVSLFEPIAQQLPLQPPNDSFNFRASKLSVKKSNSPQRRDFPPPISTEQAHFSPLDDFLSSSSFASVLDSCKCPNLGKQVHAQALKNGFHGHEFVETKLLQMYGKCGCFDNAVQLFDKICERNLYSWTAILNVYLSNGLFEEAFECFRQVRFEEFELEFFLFPAVLKICCGYGGAELGKQLHGTVIKYGFASNVYVGNALIDMYGKCGSLDNAKEVLNKMSKRDCVSWNSVITAFAANGMLSEALEVFNKMSAEDHFTPNFISWSALVGGFSQNGYNEEAIEYLYKMQAAGFQPNAQTLASVLPACGRLQMLYLGKEIHGYLTRHELMSNSFVVNGLIDVYRRCGDMENALLIFSMYSMKVDVSYNTMLVGYFENGEISKAQELFYQMEHEGKCEDIISWNSMISGYVNNFKFNEALNMFQKVMWKEEIEADSFTLGSALAACADMGLLRCGKEIHSYAIGRGLQTDPFVGGALVELYSKCLDVGAAQKAFDEVNERDISTWNALLSCYARSDNMISVESTLEKMKADRFDPNIYTWNSIIAGHVENAHNESALQLFLEMQSSGLRPDIYTIGTVLPACSRLATLDRGKQIHAYAIRFGYDSNTHIGSAVVDMYAKCGCVKHARLAYDNIKKYNLVTENAMLTAYAMHGHGEEGIAFFRRILDNGFVPDDITFLSALSSCVHAGLVETGLEFFNLMGSYNVKPTLKHYTCMVDLLSRTGKINEALKVVNEMPLDPDTVIWGALLGGCVIHGNVEVGEIAANKLIKLEPGNTGNHVMLANLYASVGRWGDLAKIRQLINERKMHKNPGCSWLEDKGEIHVFVACDTSHQRTDEIYEILNILTSQISGGN